MEIKIKSYKVQQQGIRGKAIALPKVWLDDLNLVPGDKVDFYRDEEDRLILVANKKEQEDRPKVLNVIEEGIKKVVDSSKEILEKNKK